MDADNHKIFMQMAIALARKGQGRVSPNPMVGALLVQDDHVIAEGWHTHFGGEHAEAMVLKKYVGSLEDVTLYCTLEPCCHRHKKTPPCLDLLIKNKSKKVVIGLVDPNPNVAGRSIEILRSHGVDVEVGVCHEECRELIKEFAINQLNKRPYLHVKFAQSLNGFFNKGFDERTILSNEKANQYVHHLRYQNDAILISGATLNFDNPQLSIRLNDDRDNKNLIKIIIGDPNNYNLDSYLFKQHNKNKIIFLSKNVKKLDSKVMKIISDLNIKLIDSTVLSDAMNTLCSFGIGTILIETGPKLLNTLIKENLWDEMTIIINGEYFESGPQLNKNIKLDLSKAQIINLNGNISINIKNQETLCSLV